MDNIMDPNKNIKGDYKRIFGVMNSKVDDMSKNIKRRIDCTMRVKTFSNRGLSNI